MKATYIFLNCVKKNMFRPYYIENWTLVLDTDGLGIGDLPVGLLKTVIGNLSRNYCACLNQMFILNPGFGLRNLWSVVKPFLDEETQEKI